MSTQEKATQPARIEIQIEGGLTLKQLVEADAPAYFGVIQVDPEHLRRQHPGGTDPTADKYPDVESVLDSIVNPENPDKLRFGIWDGDTMVGSINYTPGEDRTGEIGYMLAANQTGKGYMTKTVRALTEYLFENEDIDALAADVFVGNEASKKTLERSGFTYVGTFERERDGQQEQLWDFRLNRS